MWHRLLHVISCKEATACSRRRRTAALGGLERLKVRAHLVALRLLHALRRAAALHARGDAAARRLTPWTSSSTARSANVESAVGSLAELVAALGLAGKRIAIERNGAIVPKSRYAETPVTAGRPPRDRRRGRRRLTRPLGADVRLRTPARGRRRGRARRARQATRFVPHSNRLPRRRKIAPMNAPTHPSALADPLVIAGRAYRSRLLVGTGKYKDFAQTRAAVDGERRRDRHGRDPPHEHRPGRRRAVAARRAAAVEFTLPAEHRGLLHRRRCRAHAAARARAARRPPAGEARGARRPRLAVPRRARDDQGRRDSSSPTAST